MAGSAPRTEFNQALKAIATERGLDSEVIIETIKQAYVAAYRRDARERGEEVENFVHEAVIDPVSGEAKIMQYEADPETGEKKGSSKDVTPPGFGRIAAQTAKQVIHQKIREAEKGALMDEYQDRIGTLVSGTVLRFDGSNVRVDLGRAEGLMPADERIPTERLSSGQRLTFLLKDIVDGPRGKQIILSRVDPEFVKAVFNREVPEIASGSVEIKALAREPGARVKIAVHSSQPGVDPVGSCVGQRGVRVQSVTNELGGERVDIIPWTTDEQEFIKSALAPVEISSIKLGKDSEGQNFAEITVPEDQLSLAIGRDGQNSRLASRITGYKIEIKAPEGSVKTNPRGEQEVDSEDLSQDENDIAKDEEEKDSKKLELENVETSDSKDDASQEKKRRLLPMKKVLKTKLTKKSPKKQAKE